MSPKPRPHELFVCVRSMERYDPSKNSWETVASMADKRINFGVGVMLGFIFVVGGHNGVSHLSSIERYDPHQNQWTVCRPMKEPRTGRDTGDLWQFTRGSCQKVLELCFGLRAAAVKRSKLSAEHCPLSVDEIRQLSERMSLFFFPLVTDQFINSEL